MRFFGQYWFLQGIVTACMLFGISAAAACSDNNDCTTPNGVCTEGKCVCTPDYAGPACASDNPCKGETCNNHGTCAPSEDNTPVAVCTCETGYTGTKCETDIDECTETGADGHDCDKNAACTNTPPGSYTCTCNDGFVGDGKTCTATTCTADGNECLNGGTCDIPTGGTAGTCSCQSGYEGPTCENDIDECTETGADGHDCDKNAACTNTPPGSYTCTCNDGFVGDGKTCTATTCTADGNECLNGGTCDIPTGGTAGTCSCQSGYEGPTCENASGAAKISVHIMLSLVVAGLAQLSLH